MATKNILKLQSTSQVGERISAFIKTAAATGAELHEIMVQCLLHAREHGDVNLCSRLVNELSSNKAANLKAAAAVNVQGIRFWFGTFGPLTVDNEGKWSMLKTGTETYNKYVDRLTKAYGVPDTTSGPGGRVFWAEAGSTHPYWDMKEVQREQGTNIRVIGVTNLLSVVGGLQAQFDRAVKDNKFGGDLKTGQDFIDHMQAAAKAFKDAHAAEIVHESDDLVAMKRRLEREAKEALVEAAKTDLADQPTDQQETVEPVAEVGGDVAEGLRVEEPRQTGTEG